MSGFSMFFGTVLLAFTSIADERLVLGDVQRLPLPNHGQLSVSPSEAIVALVSSFECHMFVLDPDGEHWSGPYESGSGGFLGTREKPDVDSLNFMDPAWQARRKLPYFGWVITPDWDEALVLDPVNHRAIRVRDGAVEQFQTTQPLDKSPFNPLTGRWDLHRQWGRELDSPAKGLYEAMRLSFPRNPSSAVWPAAPKKLAALHDFSPDGEHVLCRLSTEDHVVALSTATGATTAYPIDNGRPRVLPPYYTGSFSPDGNYVLMQFQYSCSDHYGGGYYQLFTLGGEFVTEIGEMDPNTYSGSGFHAWLSNDWIVYSTGKRLVFQKIERETMES